MEKILVPCDFSTQAVQAFKVATDIASITKGEVLVLHSIEFLVAYETTFVEQPYSFDNAMEVMENDAQRNFNEMKDRYANNNLPVRLIIDYGSVTDSIRKHIDGDNIDLVVMGTHGATGIKEAFLGSTTEKIVRSSHAPVLAVKSPLKISDIRNIVFPTVPDFSQTDFISKIKALQNFLNATLHILYINTPINYSSEKDILNELEDYAKYCGLNNYTLNIRSSKSEEIGIVSFTDEIKADMIAMATHGRKGLLHFISGSIAEDIVNHTTCPVWTYTLKHPDSYSH